MRLQRKIMMVETIIETTRAFVKLKQIKAAVSAGGTKFENLKISRSAGHLFWKKAYDFCLVLSEIVRNLNFLYFGTRDHH